MENLAYLHAASVYEDLTNSEIISVSSLFDKAAALNWNRLSGKAWKYMLPLALILSVLNVYSSALALEQGDKGPSVRNLQRELKRTGFYQAPITQVYDVSTEEAVRRFQKAAGLEVTGVAGPVTIQKLDGWETEETPQSKKPSVESSTAKKPSSQNTQVKKPSAENPQAKKPSSQNTQAKKTSVENSQAEKTSSETAVANKRRDANLLQRGDEGEDVKILQERLRVAGFYYGNSTGIYGPITEDAVKRFQEAYKLTVDGVVGPATQRRLPPVGVGYGEAPTRRGISQDKLRLGDTGEAVRVLQEQLIKAGYLQGEPNGYFGPYTADAVKRFQTKNYLAASGIAGPTTRSKLHDLVSPGEKSDFDTLEIQRRLQSRGFYKGDLNGVMGEDTKEAIKQAQKFYGISLSDVRSGRF
ncbi:cell wall-binding protein [Scytonema sp. UIC 10036]|uniref:peptidoglycan-binding protein n=1 Tax=Scytonema sp. UIC 10036 TaxID=2304196 RepID=UPI0012DA9953|nr:peptidoglycan-binding protein [Scytonema sp. UIC 10036]MUG94165.1 cell wall-binding protein [Scytonema sp. UIC 10036]